MKPFCVIDCTPKRFPQRGFRLEHDGQLFDFTPYANLSGWKIAVGNVQYTIRRKGLLLFRWSMMHGSDNLITAEHKGIQSHIDIDTPSGAMRVERVPFIFLSTVDLVQNEKILAKIAPRHPFARAIRVTLFAGELPTETLLFTICLAVSLWSQIPWR
ncbi:MAG: hypothetical protein RLO80_01995 [Hyphomonas sp.]